MSEIEITGSGDPDADFKSIQDAVNGYDVVSLLGSFNLAGKETGTGTSTHVIEITRSVSIVGGRWAVIVGGERPFYINAPGAIVSIDNVRFQNSRAVAIAVIEAVEVTVRGCSFQGVVPVTQSVPGGGMQDVAIAISVGVVKAKISIVGNKMNIGGTTNQSTNGTIINSIAEAIEISGNEIENTTAHGIDVRSAPAWGKVVIVGNTLRSGMNGRSGGPGLFTNSIRCTGSGNYTVQDNIIEYASLNGAGIRLAATSQALVLRNTINMALSTGTPGQWSAGIQVQGTCTDNTVQDNTIFGRARVALAAIYSNEPMGSLGTPSNTTFERNDHSGFTETFADIEVGEGVSRTKIYAAAVSREKGESTAVGESAALAMSAPSGSTTSTEDIRPEPVGTLYDAGSGTEVYGYYKRLPLNS